MKKIFFSKTFAFLLILGNSYCYAQSVGVSGNGSVPDASALLDIDATGMSPQKGLLIPRVALTSSTDATTIATPATSLMIYNTTAAGSSPTNVVPGYYYNSGTTVAPVWVQLLIGGSTTGTAWELGGNLGTTAGLNYIGTQDATDVVLGSSGLERMRIASGGNVGIGTAAPDATAKFDISATDKGLLIPRIGLTSSTDATTIVSPTTSLLVYNTSTISDVSPGYYYWTGTSWSKFVNSGTGGGSHYVGELYGGGVVFYVYGNGAGVQTALIASLNDQSVSQAWSNTLVSVPAGGACGTTALSSTNGYCNSVAIQAQDATSAANLCLTYTSPFTTPACNSCSPWYLPAVDEFTRLTAANISLNLTVAAEISFFKTKANLSGGTAVEVTSGVNNYWTSTENAADKAKRNGGSQQTKTTPYYVRCIRSTTIVVSAPAAAGSITGTTPVCASMVGVNYSVPTITGASSYVWSYSGTGFSITSGAGTRSITASFSAGATGGNLTVYGVNDAGNGTVSPNYAITVTAWNCGCTLAVNHTAGTVAPETKSANYGTVTSSLSGASKCWITQNLGSTNQASSSSDNTDASAGWYWQFNRKQGYKVGPTPSWTITSINEGSDWVAAQDPCTIELGSGWRIPTYTEWLNADANGGWNNVNNTYNSVLKIHYAGRLTDNNGSLNNRGTYGHYWSSTQNSATNGWRLHINTDSSLDTDRKAFGFPLRCIKD